MVYIYPKKINIDDINIIELKNRFIIKNTSILNIYGIIIKLENLVIVKEYNNYKIILKNGDLLRIYEDYISNNIKNYKRLLENNEINIKSSEKIFNYYKSKKKELYLNIHYVKKSGFLNIPAISIL